MLVQSQLLTDTDCLTQHIVHTGDTEKVFPTIFNACFDSNKSVLSVNSSRKKLEILSALDRISSHSYALTPCIFNFLFATLILFKLIQSSIKLRSRPNVSTLKSSAFIKDGLRCSAASHILEYSSIPQERCCNIKSTLINTLNLSVETFRARECNLIRVYIHLNRK